VGRSQAIELPTISTSAPEYGAVDFAKDVCRVAGQYVLDQVNPVQQIQNQAQMVQQVGQTIAEGYNLAKELLTRDGNIENLQRAAEVQPDSRSAFERLQQAIEMEPSMTGHDALERLSETVGMDRKDPLADLTQTLDKTPVQEIAPTLEPAIEEHTIEPLILSL
jgi:hypothetical protein